MIGTSIEIPGPNQRAPETLTAFDFLREAETRRIALIGGFDSNGLFGGNGWEDGLAEYLASRYGLYATPFYTPEPSNTAQSKQGWCGQQLSTGPLGAASGAPAALEALAHPFGGYFYQASGGIGAGGSQNGILLENALGAAVNAALRGHFAYGQFPSGGGSFRSAIRRGDTPYTTLNNGTVVSTSGAYDKAVASVDLAAGVRDYPVHFRWANGSNNSVGPNVQYWSAVENRDMQHGIQMSLLYSASGQSAWDMAKMLVGMPDSRLISYFEDIIYLQGVPASAAKAVFIACFGLNDRNETGDGVTTVSWGPDAVSDLKSAAAFADNHVAIVGRLEAMWVAAGGAPANFRTLLMPSHPVTTPDDAKLVGYRSAAQTLAATHPRISVFDLTEWIDATTMAGNGWYDAAGNEHLASAEAYRGMAALFANVLD